jgi:SAM-dependent methyltransferase
MLGRKRQAPALTAREPRHDGPVLDRTQELSVVDCAACGFAHVVPLPDERELSAIYAQSYYSETKPDYLIRARADEPWARLGFDDRLDLLEAHLKPARRRLLDIGSGPGFFAARARERGWAAQGIDPSMQACAHARALDVPVLQALFDDKSAQTLGEFDAITLTNMLEHVADPFGIIARAHACLKDSGLICVTVPNDYNLFQEALRANGTRAWWVAPPHHLNYFSFESLSSFLSRHGFAEIARTTSFPMEMFALMGDNYIDNDALGRVCHKERVAFDLALAQGGQNQARRRFYGALAAAGLGREAIILARKV